jgi:small conductance mechanosensitive channel
MNPFVEKTKHLNELMMAHGLDFIEGVIVVIIGILIIRWVQRRLKVVLERMFPQRTGIATYINLIGVVLILFVFTAAAAEAGLPAKPVFRLLTIVTMIAVGGMLIFRPLLPGLPFKVGNTIRVGDLLGKVEAITFLNTRLLTFDGETIFVPNRKIFDDIVVNLHYTNNRRIKINLGIHHNSDLMKAKQILERVMVEDPRTLSSPRPVVYALDLTPDGVTVGARCWVPNLKWWLTKCELHEKIKFHFDREGICIAHHQADVYLHTDHFEPQIGEIEEGKV